MKWMFFLILSFGCLDAAAASLDFKFDPDVRRPVEKAPNITDPFLMENAKREGVVVLPSGVQIEMLSVGYGRKPTEKDSVVIDYNGWLSDGTLFDSSYKRGQPATFSVAGVVPGFAEGLMNIRMGGHAKVYIPSYLGYGKKGSGRAVPPDSTLVFEIEILDVIE
jgi:FKBP-type peptidyl-prolyl cis-trans isomerase FklB